MDMVFPSLEFYRRWRVCVFGGFAEEERKSCGVEKERGKVVLVNLMMFFFFLVLLTKEVQLKIWVWAPHMHK